MLQMASITSNFLEDLSYNRNSQEYVVTSGISALTTGITASGGESIEGVESIKEVCTSHLCFSKQSIDCK